MALAIKTEGLTKYYGSLFRKPVVGVEDLSLSVEAGQIYGLVGPNGSGKTTTLKLLLGLIFPTKGTMAILGREARDPQARRHVGFLPDGPYFYDHLNADELLRFYGGLFGLSGAELQSRADELLEMVDMAGPERHRRIGEYSKGMIQRIGVAQALINDPDLILLDEPTAGLDPLGALQMREIMFRLREEGKTVFLCSHLLWDIERICDNVTILNDGRAVREGSLEELLGDEGDTRRTLEELFIDTIRGEQ
ncbi:MAG: ABC transporter ATP-binding protein [Armatimonadota bacterium]|jgi:ABC-2 type transport system ATP-binding protein